MFAFKIQTLLTALVGLLAAIVLSAGLGYWRGYLHGVQVTDAKWTDLRLEWENEAREREYALRTRGDELAAELEVLRKSVRIQTVEVVRTIYKRASATKSCFSPDITELLNRQTPIRERVERPDGAVRVIDHKPDIAGTSELAAAEWVANAREAHEGCRAQVGKLTEWIRAIREMAK